MTEGTPGPAYTRHHWAKSDRENRGRIHLLEHHLADVGACFEALMRQPTIRQRLATTGGLSDLDESLVARLSVFAALHDIGKVNMGFQTRIWRDEDLPGKPKPGWAGHTDDVVPVLTGDDYTTYEWFSNALDWDDFLTWDDRGGETVCAMLVATLSHHGRPLQLDGGRSKNPAIWRKFGDLKPEDCVRRIGWLLRGWFPAAFEPGGSPLPSAPPFQHMFLGLCTLADWIGSDERHFRYCDQSTDDYIHTARKNAKRALCTISLDIQEQSSAFLSRPLPDFAALFEIDGGKPPNAIQNHAVLKTPLEESVVIIESETGSGKTEAALWRFAKMYQKGLVDGLYFALPTRVAASQMYDRVKHFTKQMFPDGHQPLPVLAVPGYICAGDFTGKHLPDYQVMWEDRPNYESRARRWAAENAKRFLAAQIAVGTVDQAMMGALKVKNAHMRAACLARNLLVIDEVHASDTYMSVVLEALLDAHVGAGGYALLMSATLGSAARTRWLHHGRKEGPSLSEAICAPYPAVSTTEGMSSAGENDQGKTVSVKASPTMRDFGDTAKCALDAARADAKVLVVRNTVGHAVSTQQALEELAGDGDAGRLFDVEGKTTLHHGRFAACDRAMFDKRIEELLGKSRQSGGRVVVGTQTLEQSLDIDADLLITDLCPVDVLLQRIGRLHRHKHNDRPNGYASPTCIVLTPPDNDLAPLLTDGEYANGLGPQGYVYEDLRILEATRRLIGEHPEWRIPEMNRLLVERATHPDALKAIVECSSEESRDDWKAHAKQIKGGEIGDGQTAAGVTIKRAERFFKLPEMSNGDVLFKTKEEKIRTRLGDDRIDIALDPPQPSPFNRSNSIDKLAVSVRWLPDGDAPESVTPSVTDGGFTFAVGEKRFLYDRWGLVAISNTAPNGQRLRVCGGTCI